MPGPQHKEFEKAIRSISRRHHLWQVFSDFCEMAAISLYNGVHRDDEREQQYLRLVARYNKEEMSVFPQLLGITVDALDGVDTDFLGEMFMGLELSSHWHGQYFTPIHLCMAIAEVTLGDVTQHIEARGFFTVHEPAVGAGAMIIALAHSLWNKKVNYQRCMHVTAIDVDATAAHMAYIQLSLLHVPAIVYVGNSISMEMRQAWATPAHTLGLWHYRLQRTETTTITNEHEQPLSPTLPVQGELFDMELQRENAA